MAATKINLTKVVCTINDNAVRGRFYENFVVWKFIIQKFLCMKISRSTVVENMAFDIATCMYESTLNQL